MQTLTSLLRSLLLRTLAGTLLVISATGCASNWKKGITEVEDSSGVQKAVAQFTTNPKLQTYFDEAVAYAIFPKTVRAGSGFGGALGRGWVVQEQAILGRAIHWQFLAGADLGVQMYGQIIFFKTQDTLDEFMEKGGNYQFGGQVNATAGLWGKGWTPAYSPEVVVFTVIDGGLMLEGSVGLHSYHLLKP